MQSEQFVNRLQHRARLTKSNLQRALMRLNLNQRLEIVRREKGIIRKSLYDSIEVYADKKELINVTDLASLRNALQAKGFIGINKISIRFLRHGVFVENGAPVKTRKGKAIKQTQRPPRKWLSVVLPHEIDAFEEIVADEYGGMIASQMRVLIPGIFDSRAIKNINI